MGRRRRAWTRGLQPRGGRRRSGPGATTVSWWRWESVGCWRRSWTRVAPWCERQWSRTRCPWSRCARHTTRATRRSVRLAATCGITRRAYLGRDEFPCDRTRRTDPDLQRTTRLHRTRARTRRRAATPGRGAGSRRRRRRGSHNRSRGEPGQRSPRPVLRLRRRGPGRHSNGGVQGPAPRPPWRHARRPPPPRP